jgi:hypothetical protein
MNTLSWNASPTTEQVTSYRVYEHIGTSYNLIATVAPPSVSYLLGSITGTHVYCVAGVNTTGEGPKSNEVTATGTLPLPSAPVNLRIV